MFIYEIKNKLNAKRYFGQSIQITKHRLQEHKSKLRAGRHENRHLLRAWKKYGEDAFEWTIVEYCNTIAKLNELETYYVYKFNTLDRRFGYNIREPGNNSKLSDETKQRISIAKMGISVHTPESIEKIRSYNIGRKHSEESKLKRSQKLKGRKLPMWQKDLYAQSQRPNGYPDIVESNGDIYSVVNMTEFCKKHKLVQQSMSKVVNGLMRSHHGWTVLGR